MLLSSPPDWLRRDTISLVQNCPSGLEGVLFRSMLHVTSLICPYLPQNSIRHNLSLNSSFQKMPRPLTDRGKGAYWTVNDNVDPRAGVQRIRKKKPRGPTVNGKQNQAAHDAQLAAIGVGMPFNPQMAAAMAGAPGPSGVSGGPGGPNDRADGQPMMYPAFPYVLPLRFSCWVLDFKLTSHRFITYAGHLTLTPRQHMLLVYLCGSLPTARTLNCLCPLRLTKQGGRSGGQSGSTNCSSCSMRLLRLSETDKMLIGTGMHSYLPSVSTPSQSFFHSRGMIERLRVAFAPQPAYEDEEEQRAATLAQRQSRRRSGRTSQRTTSHHADDDGDENDDRIADEIDGDDEDNDPDYADEME